MHSFKHFVIRDVLFHCLGLKLVHLVDLLLVVFGPLNIICIHTQTGVLFDVLIFQFDCRALKHLREPLHL